MLSKTRNRLDKHGVKVNNLRDKVSDLGNIMNVDSQPGTTMHKIENWKNPNNYANSLKLKSKSTLTLLNNKNNNDV